MVRQGRPRRVENDGAAFVPRDKDADGCSTYLEGVGASLIEPMSEPTTAAPEAASPDEAFDAAGRARGSYAAVFERFGPGALAGERERVREELAAGGVVFGGRSPRPFDVDPVPRIVEAAEWGALERGLIQRVRALNAFLADVYGERRIVAAGLIERELIDSAEWFEPAMADAAMPRVVAHVAGPDLVRGADGALRVLEDNLRAPSGFAYALAARRAMAPLAEACGLAPRPLEDGLRSLGRMLRAAAPAPVANPLVVLLNDGDAATTLYEHRRLAEALGLEVASPGELRREGELLLLGGRRVDVIYRRVDDERLTGPDGAPTALGELLIEPLRAGAVACVNSPGSGVADDKAVHCNVESMIGFYLEEEVLLSSVPGRWLGDPGELEPALERLAELVVKPRSEFGGSGVLIGPLASADELALAAERIRRAPGAWVAQEPVALSVHPTVVGEGLEGRHIDLRPFVVTDPGDGPADDGVTVVPGGLTRFARGAGEMVVNSGQGGGAKDTWVLPAE